MIIRTIATTALLGLCVPACTTEERPPVTPATPPAAPEAEEPEDPSKLPGKDPNKSSVVLDEKLRAMCAMPTAHFDFDSANLSVEAASALDALATCFVSGPAMGRRMKMVGHADPRGPEDYNLALGQRRAGAVALHLISRGVSTDRVETSSRGELDARGTGETSWAMDRKVEVFLVEPPPQPMDVEPKEEPEEEPEEQPEY